uniref:Cell cycle control protein n=1 Tax=Salmo trutta TaxID=8032 RepID=A0A673W651_SALTR
MGKAKANAGLLARRPDNSAFKHQRLPVWSPMLTAHTTVLPFFYCMATICVKLGVCLLVTVQNTHELKVYYTHAGPCDKCFETTIYVFFYYGDDGQMPFIKENNGLPIAPCRAMANDSFTLTYYSGEGGPVVHVPLFRKGITWYTNKNVKFRNQPDENKTLTLAHVIEDTARPLYWEAAFPNFKKLYGTCSGFLLGQKGSGTVHSQNNFLPVAYLITGCLILLLAVILPTIWWQFGKNRRNMKE